jgi:hypothetical protein
MEIARANVLRGLSLFARAQFGVNAQAIKPDMMPLQGPLTTLWRSYEVSARYRWSIADTAAIEASAGYVRDQLEFNGMQADIDQVPDADYQSIRVGAKGLLHTSTVDPYLAFEGRIVLSGGILQQRFTKASVNGLHGAAGLAAKLGPLAARLEASITSYMWDFAFDNSTSIFRAHSGTDRVILISTFLAYQY